MLRSYTVVRLPVGTAQYIERMPTSFTLSGSNDGGTTWTQLDARSGVVWTSASSNNYVIASPASYRSYRFTALASNSTDTYPVGVAELRFLGEILESGDTLDIRGEPGDYGVVSPPYGSTNGLASGASFTCSAPTNATSDGATYSFTGYKVYDIDAFSGAATNTAYEGTSTNFTYIHAGHPRRLVWKWNFVSYKMTASTDTPTWGTVAVSGDGVAPDGTFPPGSNATVTATPAAGYAFYRWTGDFDPSLAYDNPITFSKGATLKAVFGKAVYVATTGLDTAGGTSWADATTLLKAIASAEAGDVVVVSNGTYTCTTGSDFIIVTNAIAIRGVTGDWKDVVFDANGRGRGVQLRAPGALLAGVTVKRGCSNSSNGVNIYAATSGVSHCRSTLGKCGSGQTGIGIYNNGGGVFDCQIDGNSLGGWIGKGSGLRQSGNTALTARCVITDNNSGSGNLIDDSGCAVWIEGGVVRDSVISANYISSLGALAGNCDSLVSGVYVNSGTLLNCAVIGNYTLASVPNTYGVYCASASARVVNCLITDNTGGEEAGEKNWTGSAAQAAQFSNCSTIPIEGIAGGVSSDSETSFLFTDNQLELFPGSPLIDAGATVGEADEYPDLNGLPRLVGTAIDIGPVEYQQPAAGGLVCTFTAGQTQGLGTFSTTLTAQSDGATSGIVYYWDTNGDGVTDVFGADQATIQATFDQIGTTTVTLCATNGVGASSSWSWNFIVNPVFLYVVQGNTNSVAPYTTWATAAPDIKAAVDAATDGSTVIVSNGTYCYSSSADAVTLNRAVTVRGFTGNPADVVVDGNWKGGVIAINHPDAVLSGVTATRGQRYYYAAGVYMLGGGMVTNCRVTANAVVDSGAKGAGIYNVNGTVVDCVIDGNTGRSRPYGLGLYQEGARALTDRCVITNHNFVCGRPYVASTLGSASACGVAVAGGTVRNSLIADNAMTANWTNVFTNASGVAMTAGSIENCTIVRNGFGAASSNGTFTTGVSLTGGTMVNTLILDNTNTAGIANWIAGGAATFSNCCATAAATLPGADNIEAGDDPQGVYTLVDGVLALPLNSPCFNKGRNADWMAGATDLAGNRRIFGRHVDIGAIESLKSLGIYIIIR